MERPICLCTRLRAVGDALAGAAVPRGAACAHTAAEAGLHDFGTHWFNSEVC